MDLRVANRLSPASALRPPAGGVAGNEGILCAVTPQTVAQDRTRRQARNICVNKMRGNGVSPRVLPVNPANPAILSKRTEGPGRGGGFSTARATAPPHFAHFSHTFPPAPVVDSPLERPLLSIPIVRPLFLPHLPLHPLQPFHSSLFTLHS